MGIQIIWMFIKNYWKPLAIILLLVSCYVYVESLRVENAHQATQISQLKDANNTLTENNTKLKEAIAQSNKAIEKTAIAGDTAVQQFSVLNKKIEQENATLKQKLANVLKVPPPTTCNDTIKYLIDAAGEYK